MQFHFTSATIAAVIGAALAVAISFGAHLTRQNTDAILTLVGLLAAAITIGGGVKTAGMIRAGLVGGNSFHFTPALIVGIIGAAIAVAVSFGLHVSQENIDAIMKLVGLVFGGIIVGGGAKSSAMMVQGTHPLATAGHTHAAHTDSIQKRKGRAGARH